MVALEVEDKFRRKLFERQAVVLICEDEAVKSVDGRFLFAGSFVVLYKENSDRMILDRCLENFKIFFALVKLVTVASSVL